MSAFCKLLKITFILVFLTILWVVSLSLFEETSGTPIRKLTDAPITDILAVVISDVNTNPNQNTLGVKKLQPRI